MKKTAYFYYDIISPFAYLFLKQRKVLEERLTLIPAPIFLPGLLKMMDNRGPAEIPEKRVHTYKFCVWQAMQLGVTFVFPKSHPFPSASAQRLLLHINADFSVIDKAFDFVWQQGNDPDANWAEFCQAIGVPKETEKPKDDNIKEALKQQTTAACQKGVFGVPSLMIDDHFFWGCDSIPWVLQYLDNPKLFDNPLYQNALKTENPLLRQPKV
jgi:2-hydroxychromene-2-carboxylate isomerase